MKPCRLAIVVPCYNEEAVLAETHAQLYAVLEKLIGCSKAARNSFILYVNDGSNDATWELIEKFHRTCSSVYGLKLAGNVGHQHALMAGLLAVKGMCDAAISIDADLQDDVAVMETMLDRFNDGHDIVYGVRKSREMDTMFKRYTALIFYTCMRALAVKTVYNHADYRLLSRRALEHLALFNERNLFLRGIVPLIGFNAATVHYDRLERCAGASKYPLRKMFNFALDGVTSFSTRPIRFIAVLGFALLCLSMLATVYVLVSYFSGHVVAGWASLMLSVWFLGSIILLSLGVVGEYVGKIYIETKQRPRYNIETFLSRRDD